MRLETVLNELRGLASPDVVAFKERKFAVASSNSLGIYQKQLKTLAKKLGRNNELALALYQTGIYEARLLVPLIYDPKMIRKSQMNAWVREFDNWEYCDSYCMGFFVKSPFAIEKTIQWSTSKAEFTKRAAFAMMAAYGFAHKNEGNEVFESFLPIIAQQAGDERNFVKKAVNWALRSVGKRNQDLRSSALVTAQQILREGQEEQNKAKLWVAKDALKELNKENLKVQDYPRSLYRP